MRHRSWTWRRLRLVRMVCWPVVMAVAVAMVGQQPAIAAKPEPVMLHAQRVSSVHATPVAPRPGRAPAAPAAPAPVRVAWPAAGSAVVDLTPGSGVRAAGLPVWLTGAVRPDPAGPQPASGPVSRLQVEVLDRAGVPAGWRDGVVLRLARADGVAAAGQAGVSVDYSAFAGAYGGDYASRLRLVALPECALSIVEPTGCAAQPLPSTDDLAGKRVTGKVTLPASGSVVVALTAGASGSAGDFSATSLRASSSWSAGGNSGDFSWQYPIDVPPSLGGPAPTVALSYSSSSVDGRNATTNNQPSWVGEGFDFWPGYIERSYKPCEDDKGSSANNTKDTGDECWGTDNAVLSMSGRGGDLIKDGATGAWRIQDDDNTRIEHLTNTVNADNDHEYWRLTTTDGTQYYFGLNQLPGYTGTAPANRTTDSVWTEPVAGNNSGEPCHQASFTDSFCQQAWRWNLDYVVDPHGNTMSLFYASEKNAYARNDTDTDVQTYVRGGWLKEIDYGTDRRSGPDTVETANHAAMRLSVGVDDRCLSDCGTHDVAHWADTPWDQNCATDAKSCPGLYTPTFWITKRLSTITTSVWDPAASAYKDVDQWTLTHSYPPSGDDTRNGLWLQSIVHTGKATGPAVVGGAITEPSVSFDWTQLANRVDTTTDGEPAMNWMRVATIWTDTGDKISVRYSSPDCVPGSRMPSSPQSNTLLCYPVLEEQPDRSIKTEYFNKYLVKTVTEEDLTGGGPDVTTSYDYQGSPAWRHTDDDGMTKDNLRTWSDFRGYAQVNTRVGQIDGGQQTLTETKYFRGMNGDLNGSGGTRSVTLPALDLNGDGDTADTGDAPAVPDDNGYAGQVRQSTVYNGVESDPLSVTVSQPWQSSPTATRDMGDTTVYARHTGTASTWSATKLAAGGWRVTRSDTTFDAYGMPAESYEQGDVAVAGDEKCTTTSYNRNTDANLLDLPGEIDIYALPCPAQGFPVVQSEADIVSMTRTMYDHQSYGGTPTKGESTETDVAKAWSKATGVSWLPQSTGSYDVYGRLADVTDVRGNHTTTVYTPSAGAPVTKAAVTGPQGTTTSTMEPSWGSVTAVVDINNKRTDVTRDALGRTSQVWQPNHTKANYPSQPSVSYAYLTRNSGGVNAVTTSTLNGGGGYTTTIALYDGLLRPRQTQTVSAAADHKGTVFADTQYDTAGRAFRQQQYFDADVQPSTTLYQVPAGASPAQTDTSYDRASRPTAQVFISKDAEKWRTTTSYGGDRVNVVPPQGGVATTTVSDGLGRTTAVRQYDNPADVGSDNPSLFDQVTYHYNRKGQQDSWTDNAGNTWTAGFDLLGRQTTSHDPDRGDSVSAYNDQGDLQTSTDGRQRTLAYQYDNLGRKTFEYDTSTSGAKLAAWTYDPPGAKGQLATSSRFVGAAEYRITVGGYNALYQPTGVIYTIPATQTGIAGSYEIDNSYNVDGSPDTVQYPAAAGLLAETLTYKYDATTGLPNGLQTNYPNNGQYVTDAEYTAYGELSFVQYQTTGLPFVQRTSIYDEATHRLADAKTNRQNAPQLVEDTGYTYDPSGNITKTVDTSATGAVDTQCFGYDYADRLVDAWTPGTGDCAATKSASALGGPAPYWQTWTFDAAGDRKTQTDHTTAGDVKALYTYPTQGANSAHPHAVSEVDIQNPGGTTTTHNYSYDPAGNTTGRPGPVTGQTLNWDTEGNLASVTDASGNTSSYIYDADGNRLIAVDPTTTTLYLPGEDVVRSRATGAVTATRYYTFGGGVCAQNSSSTGSARITWLVTDQQGTQQTEIDNGNQTVTQRRQNPYGASRGTSPTWLNTRGFVGGTDDPTGLVHEGAREYDTGLGRFVSVDPQFDSSDPQSWQGYGYADNNPVSGADPTGLYHEWEPAENDKPADPSMGCAFYNTCIPDHPAAPPEHKKKHHWWDKATNWVKEHKAQIAGFVVGVAVGVGCGFAIGWTGVGAVACGFLSGAAASLTEDLVEGGHSVGGIIADTIIGGVVGGALGGLGELAGAAVKPGAEVVEDAAKAGARAGTGTAADRTGAQAVENSAKEMGEPGKAASEAVEGAHNEGDAMSRPREDEHEGATVSGKEVQVNIGNPGKEAWQTGTGTAPGSYGNPTANTGQLMAGPEAILGAGALIAHVVARGLKRWWPTVKSWWPKKGQ